jgi:hypothetical protein
MRKDKRRKAPRRNRETDYVADKRKDSFEGD